jgi:SAM-dependent methyltransferase
MLRYRPGTVGTDINPLTVNWLEKQGLKAYQMLPDKLPFNDEFDSILLDNVLEHILEPVPILKEIRRVMKSSGQLLVGVPGELGYRSDPDHKVFYDQDLLVTVLSKVGFQPVKIFFTPFRAEWANRKVRQYCMYGIFKLKKI